MRRALISGWGLHVPERKVDNQFFNDLYKRDIAGFLERERNIKTRHFMKPDEATSDLILPAAERALAKAKITAKDLDLIIIATDTPDYLSPSTAAVVQFRLGAERAGVFDLNSACAGFVTALDVAQKFIAADTRYRHILVVGAYGMSKFLNWDDFKIATLFADGAGAFVVSAGAPLDQEPETPRGVLATELWADGQFHDYMGLYGGGTKNPLSHALLEKQQHLLAFTKKIPIETNTTHWPRLTHRVLDRIHRTLPDVKKFFFTQINIQLIRGSLDALGLPHEASHNIMDRYGYTGSACIPMAICDAADQGAIKSGDLLMLLASGGGVSMAAMAIEWGPKNAE